MLRAPLLFHCPCAVDRLAPVNMVESVPMNVPSPLTVKINTISGGTGQPREPGGQMVWTGTAGLDRHSSTEP
jgi:hypothetical protein